MAERGDAAMLLTGGPRISNLFSVGKLRHAQGYCHAQIQGEELRNPVQDIPLCP